MPTILRCSFLALFAALACLLTACGGGGGTRATSASVSAPAPAPAGTGAAAGTLYDRVMAAHTMRVGVRTDAPPFSVRTGDAYSGFDIDIIEALAQRLKIDHVVYVPITADQRVTALTSGQVDCVIAAMTITRFREQKIDFTCPYFQDGQGLLVLKDSPVTSYLDLGGHTVGALKGATSGYTMRQVAPDAKVMVYPSYAALMAGFDAGLVDSVTSDTFILRGLVKGSKDPSRYRFAGGRFTTEPYGIAVPENQSKWRKALDHAIMDLWESGQWRMISDTWFGQGAPYQDTIAFSVPCLPH
jgi:polar amino acid transport system substrate-binding protein